MHASSEAKGRSGLRPRVAVSVVDAGVTMGPLSLIDPHAAAKVYVPDWTSLATEAASIAARLEAIIRESGS